MAELRDAVERASVHISRAFNDLYWATVAVHLPDDALHFRMGQAAAELGEAIRHLTEAA